MYASRFQIKLLKYFLLLFRALVHISSLWITYFFPWKGWKNHFDVTHSTFSISIASRKQGMEFYNFARFRRPFRDFLLKSKLFIGCYPFCVSPNQLFAIQFLRCEWRQASDLVVETSNPETNSLVL